MKSETNSRRVDILGSNRKSDQEIFGAVLKRWQRRFGYWSVFAAVPAVLASQLHVSQTVDARQPESRVTGLDARSPRKPNLCSSSRSLLKRQSEFRLPHQNANFVNLASLSDLDDCPGRAIPPGSYTATNPFIASGDTTGANDTITSAYFYCAYSNVDVPGPDHVYSFTISAKGAFPRIEIFTSSSTYRPIAYLLLDTPCPSGTGNQVPFIGCWFDPSFPRDLSFYPTNVPIYLLIDSRVNEGGPYTIRMQDVTIADPPCDNPIDCGDFFIRQQYLDFLDRPAEPEGLQFYLNILNGCHPSDIECTKYTRGALSANFFRSPEFGRKGAYVANLFNIVIGQRPKTVAELSDPTKVERPHYAEFMADLATLSTPNDDRVLTEQKKDQLASAWLARTEVQMILPSGLSNQQFVQKLESIAGVTLANESTLIANLNNGSQTRAQVLRAIAESHEVVTKFYIPNFVTMEYLGYLRRDPEDCHVSSDPENCGYIFHNRRFNIPGANPDLIENIIVRGFIESPEYRRRFGP